VELRAIGEQLGEEHPEVGERAYWVADLRDRTIGDAGRLLWILLGAVALLLVIACVNVANLFLVRATERMGELALRAALGAGSGRIARQLLTESVLLGAAGGAAGAVLAWVGVALFRRFAPPEVPRLAELAFDVRVLLFACAVSVATGIGFGLVPALRLSRGDIADRLRDRGRGSTGAVAGHRLRAAFVAGQMAIALVLLTGAALLINGFARLASVDPGFDTRGVAWLNVDLPSRRYPEAATRAAVFDRALEQVRALPGVRAAGAIHGLPLDGNRSLATVLPEGWVPTDAAEPPRVAFHSVLPGFFGALGIPLIAGRDVAESDRAGPPVVVVSAALARRFWPGESALGRRLRFGDESAPWITIVGVAGDTRHYGLAEEPEPIVYLHYARVPRNWLAIAVRHDGPAAPILDAMRQAVWSIDPDLPLDRFGTLRDVAAASLVEPRFRTAVLSFYAAIALALTFVGLYGTMTYLVRARRRELGIRLALGAATRDVYRLVLSRGLRIAAAGIGAGLLAAFLATRVLASFLFGIGTSDPATYAAGSAFLAAVALLACWIPARRAAGLDPVRTLRAD
jgi:predicted permease